MFGFNTSKMRVTLIEATGEQCIIHRHPRSNGDRTLYRPCTLSTSG